MRYDNRAAPPIEIGDSLLVPINLAEMEEVISFTEAQSHLPHKRPVFEAIEMKTTFISTNQSFDYVGNNSTFHKRITTILFIQWISFSFMVNAMAFFFKGPSFFCRQSLSNQYASCLEPEACENIGTDLVKIDYGSGAQVSITQDFRLICSRQYLAPWAQSLFFLGGFISGYLFSAISPRIGNRKTLLLALLMAIMALLLTSFSPSIQFFLIGYFLIGFCLFGYEVTVYIYIAEISGAEKDSMNRFHSLCITFLATVFAGSPIFLPLIDFIPSWRYTFAGFGVLLLVTFPFAYCCFLESPRFLISKLEYEQARSIFKKISIINRRPPYNFRLYSEIQAENQTYARPESAHHKSSIVERIQRNYGFSDLFRLVSQRYTTLALMFVWLFRFFVFSGLNLALEPIIKSTLVLTLILGAGAFVEAFGIFGASFITLLFCRQSKRDVIKISLTIISFCCAILWFIRIDVSCRYMFSKEEPFCWQIVLMVLIVMLLKFFNAMLLAVLIIYTPGVYPTTLRSFGQGLTMTFGRLGTVLVPFYIDYFKGRYSQNSLCFLTPLGILAIGACWFLPVIGTVVSETIPEEEDAKRPHQIEMRPLL